MRSTEQRAWPTIGDYAIIGDCRSAALVSREGSMDWLCLPRFDGPAVFAALLDRTEGGRFSVRPVDPFQVSRRYVGDTNVLETTFRTESGVARLTDLMPVASEEEKRQQLHPDHQVLRRVECLEGEVAVEVTYDPRPDYGRAVPKLEDRGSFGLWFEGGPEMLILRSEIPLAVSDDHPGAYGTATLRRGERRGLSLSLAAGGPAILPPLGAETDAKIERSIRWWEQWISRCRYDGPASEHVVRSALTLKLMCYAPSGAVVAAPTTSLPERIGGGRNWDYRFCWLRDASLTIRSLFDLGYPVEGEAFLSWLLHATRLTWPELQVLYDVYGETRLPERELDHLEGYAGSRPVRIGNGAADQFQLDVYGEVVEGVFQYVLRGGSLGRSASRMLAAIGKTVCRRWREPDEGIWESRAGRRQHTYSKAMCWVVLNRLLDLHRNGHVKVPAREFSDQRDAIRDEIEARGYNERLQSYVSVLDGDQLDASLLLLALNGYIDANAPRMRSTCERVYDHLGSGPLLYRYNEDDGLAEGEGTFGIASFWGVECRIRQGDIEAGAADLKEICSHANDVGLFAEEIDAHTGALLGNFPQAFTHVGLISAALALVESRGDPDGEPGAMSRLPEKAPE